MDYQLLFDTNTENLEQKVRALLNNGYEPAGGISTGVVIRQIPNRPPISEVHFFQAMWKKI